MMDAVREIWKAVKMEYIMAQSLDVLMGIGGVGRLVEMMVEGKGKL